MAPKYKLTYFNVRGLAEPIRYIFAYAGVPFEDVRLEKSEWPALKETMPFGKVPVLEVDGKMVHQTTAILRYLGNQYHLAGDTAWDSMQVDIIADTLADVKELSMAYFRLLMKEGPVDEEEKTKKKDVLLNETLPYYYTKFEAIVKENGGYFVNGKLTWVDFLWASTIESTSVVLGNDILAKYPALDALQEKVFSLPAIKAWVENRPTTQCALSDVSHLCINGFYRGLRCVDSTQRRPGSSTFSFRQSARLVLARSTTVSLSIGAMAPSYKLLYWNVKALGEPIRFLLTYGGQEFQDDRLADMEEWAVIKPTTPFGKVPVLEIDDKKIHQSLSICRYLAKQFNLVGDTPWEALQIDIIADTINDFKLPIGEYFKNVYYKGDEVERKKMLDNIKTETLPNYLTKFEDIVKANNGYFVNGKLTWADMYWACHADSLNGMLGFDMLDKYPHLKELKEKVEGLPAIKAWIEKRPKSDM